MSTILDDDLEFRIDIRRPDGSIFVAELGRGYDEQTRMERFGQGIRVTHPNKPVVYINGNTSQISNDPEICRSALILDPHSQDLGRLH